MLGRGVFGLDVLSETAEEYGVLAGFQEKLRDSWSLPQ